MIKINWEQKLTSRKWWGFICVMIVACLVLFNVDSDTITKVVALITALANVAIYTFAESKVDAARLISEQKDGGQ